MKNWKKDLQMPINILVQYLLKSILLFMEQGILLFSFFPILYVLFFRTHSIILIDNDWKLTFIEHTMEEPIDGHHPKWIVNKYSCKL